MRAPRVTVSGDHHGLSRNGTSAAWGRDPTNTHHARRPRRVVMAIAGMNLRQLQVVVVIQVRPRLPTKVPSDRVTAGQRGRLLGPLTRTWEQNEATGNIHASDRVQ